LNSENPSKSLELGVARSLLDIVILCFLEEGPLHGYMINVKFRKAFGHGLSASTIYPLLYTLEEKGYIEGEWKGESRRKIRVYSITQKGKERLASAYFILSRLTKMVEKKFERIKEGESAETPRIVLP
jgi:DNA-binding PadR family transcriptional regulator